MSIEKKKDTVESGIEICKCDQCGREIREDSSTIIFALARGFHLCSDCLQELHLNYRGEIERANTAKLAGGDKLTPAAIVKYLDQYVIGQDHAKRVLAGAVYNHYTRVRYKQKYKTEIARGERPDLDKGNILLCGRTGVGKSMLLKTISRLLRVPFVIETSNSFSSSGFVGRDIDQIPGDLVAKATGKTMEERVKKAEVGIVYLDEFDKLRRSGESANIGRDVGGEAVQQALLTLIEGAEVDIPAIQGQRITPATQTIKFNTENVLFVCGGSFEGIDKIINKRLRVGSSQLGFGAQLKDAEPDNIYQQVTTEDFRKFGMIPEVLGRLPIICPLDEITRSDLIKILSEPRNSLVKQFKAMFREEGVELEFSARSLELIADKALELKTGARGLRGIVEGILGDVLFDAPGGEFSKVIVSNNGEEITVRKEE